jgi:ribosomal protein S18 acetylase RimI-like enzyme
MSSLAVPAKTNDGPIEVRPATPGDAEACGRIAYAAFDGVAERHGFRADFPSPEVAIGAVRAWIAEPAIFGVVAERNGRVVGSSFLDGRDPVRGLGPVTVSPSAQGHGVGRALMEAVLGGRPEAAGVRLLEDPHNVVALSLYASLGFEVKEPVALVSGRPSGDPVPGYDVRPLEENDLEECERLCRHVHGFTRTNELRAALCGPMLSPLVAARDGRVTAYTSGTAFFAHGVAETDRDMYALLLGAAAIDGGLIELLLPMRRAGMLRWSLRQGMRVVKPMTLMATGEYREPAGCWFPSILY